MIRREYSASERRAVNQVYNGAGRYDFEPFFLAMKADGDPDMYLNMLIGLSVKWFDRDRLQSFFESYESSVRAEDLDRIVWLGLENCLFGKEVRERPIYRSLRRTHAENFFRSHQNLSRQQMMAQNIRIYEQEEERWASVLGRRGAVLSPGARKLASALALSPDLDTEGAIEHLRGILAEYFHVQGTPGTGRRKAAGGLSSILKKIMYRETHEVDTLLVRQSGTTPSKSGRTRALERGQRLAVHTQEDADYIRACFGKCLYPDAGMARLERELCRGAHEYCHLYIAGAVPERNGGGTDGESAAAALVKPESDADSKLGREAAEIRRKAEAQAEKNRAYLEKNGQLIASSVRSLTAQLDTILATFAQPLPEISTKGRLNAARCYRLPLFQDPLVFTRPGDEVEHHIKIDLLLDASASRLSVQEVISAQTCVFTESLNRLHIPCRVMTFRSLRGYTVLQILKDYQETGTEGLLHYFAAGWNRDGLALKACARLIREASQDRDESEHVLFIMTDANPDDSTHIPAQGKFGMEREYEGSDAVTDTAETVKQLRQSGIHTVAVYLGSTAHVDNASLIYGTGYVTVRNIETLAARIGSLLQRTLTEMKN